MDTFNSQDTAIIIGMVVVYIVITTWMSLRLRSKTSEQYMVAARTMPAFVVGRLIEVEVDLLRLSKAAAFEGVAHRLQGIVVEANHAGCRSAGC